MKLNEAQKKAVAAGSSMEVILALATTDGIEAAAPAAAPAATAPAPAITAPAATETPAPATSAATPAPATEASSTVASISAAVHEGIVANMQSQLTAANADLAVAKLTAQTFQAAALQTESLVGIVRGVLSARLVALGNPADSAAAFNASNIGAEFERVENLFKEKFKAGGVAATASPVSTPVTPQSNPIAADIQRFTIPS